MHLKRKLFKTAAVMLSAAVLGLFGTAKYYSSHLPETITAEVGAELKIAEYPEITFGSVRSEAVAASETFPSSHQATLSLFGTIPIKNVEIRETAAPTLLTGGQPFGIKLLMDGVMVTELGEVTDAEGNKVCPAKDAGIQVGDVICLADSSPVTSNSQIQEIISSSGGKNIKLSVSRSGSEFTTELKPVFSGVSNNWMGGMWVRDSIAGIGTITFINKETGEFAGLGHPICDSDTCEIVPLSSGEAVPVEITEAKKGQKGIPGELCGQFSDKAPLGTLNRNNSCGVFGTLTEQSVSEISQNCEEYKLGYRQEIQTGPAEIIATVDGNQTKHYDINIEAVDYTSTDGSKNMVIKITDDELLNTTGGIVQGMSGSPIIQNNKIIGAVTHVFVADPAKGYAIFAENMAEYLLG